MGQQTINSKSTQYGLANTEAGLSNYEKQQPVAVAAKKTVLRDLQHENRIMIPKSMRSPQTSKESAPTIEAIKIPSTKRPAAEGLVSNPQSPTSNAISGHLVYARRKPEAEPSKSSTRDNTIKSADFPESEKVGDLNETTQGKTQMNETKSCILEVESIPTSSLMCISSEKPSTSPSLAKSGNMLAADSRFLPIAPDIPSIDHSKITNDKYWEVRYHELQNLLKNLDQSNQNDYLRMLQSLSAVDLSRHAVELEKRSIQLSLEEAKEMQRVIVLDVLGKFSKNSRRPSIRELMENRMQ